MKLLFNPYDLCVFPLVACWFIWHLHTFCWCGSFVKWFFVCFVSLVVFKKSLLDITIFVYFVNFYHTSFTEKLCCFMWIISKIKLIGKYICSEIKIFCTVRYDLQSSLGSLHTPCDWSMSRIRPRGEKIFPWQEFYI